MQNQLQVIQGAIRNKLDNVTLSNIYTKDRYNVSVCIKFPEIVIENVVFELIKLIGEFKIRHFYLEKSGYLRYKKINIGGVSYNLLLIMSAITYNKNDIYNPENIFIFRNERIKMYKMDLVIIEIIPWQCQ